MALSFDVVVIGGGPGGYKCAELLGKGGLSVALCEKTAVGGTCLNQGCIPFKFLLHVSKVRDEARKAAKAGLFDASAGEVAQARVVAGKQRIVAGLNGSVEAMLKSCGVTLFHGAAEVTGAADGHFTVAVADAEGKPETLECSKLVIATGSAERPIEVPRGLAYRVLGSKEMLELTELPAEIDIIGAGAIGLEAASYFADAGCKVTVLEGLDHVGGHIDTEIAASLRRILQAKGITVITDAALKRFEPTRVVFDRFGEELVRTPSCVLLAIGRVPAFDEASLELLGVSHGPRGIEIDERCQTTCENVFALGDVTGKLMLAHTAYQQAKLISDAIFGKPAKPIDYNLIPRIIYTNPEVMAVGLSEDDCKAQGIAYRAATLPMTYSGKYFAENGKDGAKAKLVVDAEGRVIGFHMIGNTSSELALAAELMIAHRMTVAEVLHLSFPHPTYAEIIDTLAEMLA